jgi:hypothetical protein
MMKISVVERAETAEISPRPAGFVFPVIAAVLLAETYIFSAFSTCCDRVNMRALCCTTASDWLETPAVAMDGLAQQSMDDAYISLLR